MCKLKLIWADWPHSDWWLIDACQQYGSYWQDKSIPQIYECTMAFKFRQGFPCKPKYVTIIYALIKIWWSLMQFILWFPFSNQNSLSEYKMIRLCKTKFCWASLHVIVYSLIKHTVHPHLRTMQRTAHEKSIDLYFAMNPTALLLFSTPSNLHCPALAQSPWVIFTFRPRFLLIFLKPLCIFPHWVGGLFVQRTLSCVYQRWRPLLRKCLF